MEGQMNAPQLPLILYDERCPLCHRFKQALERVPTLSHYSFVSIDRDEIYEIIPELNRDDCHDRVHLVDQHGKIFSGSDVIDVLIREYPEADKFAWLLDSEAAKKSRDLFYQAVNKCRKLMTKNCKNCGDKHAHLI